MLVEYHNTPRLTRIFYELQRQTERKMLELMYRRALVKYMLQPNM